MSSRIKVALRLFGIRRHKAKTRASQLANSLEQARKLSDKLVDYANEYQHRWYRVAQEGGSVEMLKSEAAFSNRLRATAVDQSAETARLQLLVSAAEEQLACESERVRKLQERAASEARQSRFRQDIVTQVELEERWRFK